MKNWKKVGFFAIILCWSVLVLASDITISLPHVSASPNSTITIPITVTLLDGLNVFSYSMEIHYPASLLAYVDHHASGTLSSNGMLVSNDIEVNATTHKVSIAYAGGSSMSGEGVLLNLEFTTLQPEGIASLQFAQVTFEDGAVTAQPNNGSVTIEPEYIEASIYQIQYTSSPNGNSPHLDAYVQTSGTVTAVDTDGSFVIADNNGAWHALSVSGTGVALNDQISVQGQIQEINSITTLVANNMTINSHQAPAIAPAQTTLATLLNNTEAYESVLCQIQDVSLIGNHGIYSFSDGNYSIEYGADFFPYNSSLGNQFTSVTGIFSPDPALHPRSEADFTSIVLPDLTLSIDSIAIQQGQGEILVPIRCSDLTAYNVTGCDLYVAQSSSLPIQGVQKTGALSANCDVYGLSAGSTSYKIQILGNLAGEGILVYLRYAIDDLSAASYPLVWQQGTSVYAEYTPPTIHKQNGQLTILPIPEIHLSLPDTSALQADTLFIPVTTSTDFSAFTIQGFACTFEQQEHLQLIDVVTAGTLCENIDVSTQTETDFQVQGTGDLNGSGILFYLKLAINEFTNPAQYPLTWKNAAFTSNDSLEIFTNNGSITIAEAPKIQLSIGSTEVVQADSILAIPIYCNDLTPYNVSGFYLQLQQNGNFPFVGITTEGTISEGKFVGANENQGKFIIQGSDFHHDFTGSGVLVYLLASINVAPNEYVLTWAENPEFSGDHIPQLIYGENGLITVSAPAELEWQFPMQLGWNLLSIPLQAQNMLATSLFADATVIWQYDATTGWQNPDTLALGEGYWVKYPVQESVLVLGTPQESLSLPLASGWNLIGCLHTSMAIPATEISKVAVIWQYDAATGWTNIDPTTDSLIPGYGFWIKMNTPTTMEFLLAQ